MEHIQNRVYGLEFNGSILGEVLKEKSYRQPLHARQIDLMPVMNAVKDGVLKETLHDS